MNEQILSYVTIGGTIFTVIGTCVTLWHARKVESYSKKVAYDLRKIHTAEIIDNLRRAQDEGRKLLTSVQQLNRGKNHTKITEVIQRHFDLSLNLLPIDGPDIDVRAKIKSSQDKLRDFQNSNTQAIVQCASELHAQIQDAISISRQRLHDLEYGNLK